MKKIQTILALICFMQTMHSNSQILTAVPSVDLKKYAGKWYEIAFYPQRFQKGCHCTTAEYTPSSKGFVIVENRCNKDSINGKESYIKGKAFVVKNSGNAKLKVQFFWPFRAKYWVIPESAIEFLFQSKTATFLNSELLKGTFSSTFLQFRNPGLLRFSTS